MSAEAVALRKVRRSKEERQAQRRQDERIDWIKSAPFITLHIIAVVSLFLPSSPRDWWLCFWLYWIRMFFITGGSHRYFSHKTYETSRLFQFILAFGSTTAVQKGPLWWAAWHRLHHKHSDTENDIHSPSLRGFYWAHVGWIMCRRFHHTEEKLVKQLTKFPELRFLNTHYWLPPVLLGVAVYLWGDWSAVRWFIVSTVILYHFTFFINSLAHVPSKWLGTWRNHEDTGDTSQNSWPLALVTLGEGWHNDHHDDARSAKQGNEWWKIDVTYYILWVLNLTGVIWDLKRHSQLPKKQAA